MRFLRWIEAGIEQSDWLSFLDEGEVSVCLRRVQFGCAVECPGVRPVSGEVSVLLWISSTEGSAGAASYACDLHKILGMPCF